MSTDPEMSLEALQARLREAAAATLEDPNYVDQWLDEPNVRLGNRKPREVMTTLEGVKRVLSALIAIDYGLPTYGFTAGLSRLPRHLAWRSNGTRIPVVPN